MSSSPLRRFRPVIIALSVLTLALASVLTASAASPFADQHSWVFDHGNGKSYRVAHNSHAGNDASSSPTGLGPATINGAYHYSTSSTAGAGKIIAIVDAYDDPTAEADLVQNQAGC